MCRRLKYESHSRARPPVSSAAKAASYCLSSVGVSRRSCLIRIQSSPASDDGLCCLVCERMYGREHCSHCSLWGVRCMLTTGVHNRAMIADSKTPLTGMQEPRSVQASCRMSARLECRKAGTAASRAWLNWNIRRDSPSMFRTIHRSRSLLRACTETGGSKARSSQKCQCLNLQER